MSPQPKQSKARIFTARLNPIEEKPREKRAVELLDQLEKQGFNFKEVIVDAILRADGATPEMFDQPVVSIGSVDNEARMINRIESMLSQFAEEIIGRLASSGVQPTTPTNTDDESKVFAQNFAKSFIQRQQNLGHDLDIEDDEE